MTKKQRAEIEERIRAAYSYGIAGGITTFDEQSADYAAFSAGRFKSTHGGDLSGRKQDLVRKLVRWYDATTRISWAHFTWNWWTGCCKISDGCKNCYAEDWAKRAGRKIWGRNADRPISKDWEAKLRRWRKMSADPMFRHEFGLLPRERPRIFCGSLMDWAEGRDDQRQAVADAFDLIRENDWATFILLTKRPQNIPDLLPDDWGDGWEHVILGTSIESGEPDVIDAELQAPVIERARHLLRVPAANYLCSYEPALGPLAEELRPFCNRSGRAFFSFVIYGGETGNGFREEGELVKCDACLGTGGVHVRCDRCEGKGLRWDSKLWAREMCGACRETDTAFFHKQSAGRLNERGVELDGEVIHEYPKRGRFLDA